MMEKYVPHCLNSTILNEYYGVKSKKNHPTTSIALPASGYIFYGQTLSQNGFCFQLLAFDFHNQYWYIYSIYIFRVQFFDHSPLALCVCMCVVATTLNEIAFVFEIQLNINFTMNRCLFFILFSAVFFFADQQNENKKCKLTEILMWN